MNDTRKISVKDAHTAHRVVEICKKNGVDARQTGWLRNKVEYDANDQDSVNDAVERANAERKQNAAPEVQ